jgi:hypothetical protein
LRFIAIRDNVIAYCNGVAANKGTHGRQTQAEWPGETGGLLIRPYCVATEREKEQLQILHFAALRSG